MELNERQQQIYDIIYAKKKISVTKLTQLLYVSQMTIRRDLALMEKAGYLKRYRGGAMEIPQNDSSPILKRVLVDEEEKRQLGKLAATFLTDDICIFIDSSSTTYFVIPHIKKFSNIKVITNSIYSLTLLTKLNIPTFLIGGEYDEHDMCCIGSSAEQLADKLNVDIAFVSTLGISDDGYITDSSPNITAVKERICKNAKQTVFLFEKSKVGKKGVYTLCHKDDENVTVLFS